MSEILARIRVRETHGIRRFLYPLSVCIDFLEAKSTVRLRLESIHGEPIPTQAVVRYECEQWLDFAVSLGPYELCDLVLFEGEPYQELDDPLNVELVDAMNSDKALLWVEQKRFKIALRHDALNRDVVYDGVSFPRELPSITCNSRSARVLEYTNVPPATAKLSAWVDALAEYPDGRASVTHTKISAVKSWEHIINLLDEPKPHDEVAFTQAFIINSPTLICDFGVGGYIFGKMDRNAPEIVWHTEFGSAPYAKWTVATAGRVDYVGEVDSAGAFLPQRWFHLIDSDKALAVAITRLPDACRSMTVRLTHEGDVSIAFKLGDSVIDHADFGVCYHFLNDVPAIAAATNPQSILLPPLVEVLPVVE